MISVMPMLDVGASSLTGGLRTSSSLRPGASFAPAPAAGQISAAIDANARTLLLTSDELLRRLLAAGRLGVRHGVESRGETKCARSDDREGDRAANQLRIASIVTRHASSLRERANASCLPLCDSSAALRIDMSFAGDATATPPTSRAVDAVVFDVDGLLIDSESGSLGRGCGAEVA